MQASILPVPVRKWRFREGSVCVVGGGGGGEHIAGLFGAI